MRRKAVGTLHDDALDGLAGGWKDALGARQKVVGNVPNLRDADTGERQSVALPFVQPGERLD